MKKRLFGLFIIVALLLCPVYADETVYVSVYENINYAIDFVDDAGGGTVILEEGTHLLSNSGGTLTLDNNVTLVGQGNGTILKNDMSVDTISISGTVGTQTNVTADIMCGPLAAKEPFIVHVSDASLFSINDGIEIGDIYNKEYNEVVNVDAVLNTIEIWNRPQYDYRVSDCAFVKKITLKENIEIKSVTFEQTLYSGNAISIDYANNIRISDNDINGVLTSAHSIYLNNTDSIQITNNKLKYGRHGVSIYRYSTRVLVANNNINNCWTGICLYGNKNIIEGNLITGSGTQHGSGDGITITSYASDNIINSNIIDSGNCYGIWVTGTYPKNNLITNNVVRANITTGINVNKGEGHVVLGNIINRNAHGILVQGAKNTIISHNNIYDNHAAGVFIYQTPTGKTIITENIIKNNGKTDWIYSNDITLAYSDYTMVKDNILSKAVYIREHGVNLIIGDNFISQ